MIIETKVYTCPRCQSEDLVIALWVKKQGKRLILSVGIIPYGIQLARFLRKTLSFSKCVKIHEICLKLFYTPL